MGLAHPPGATDDLAYRMPGQQGQELDNQLGAAQISAQRPYKKRELPSNSVPLPRSLLLLSGVSIASSEWVCYNTRECCSDQRPVRCNRQIHVTDWTNVWR
ncbi:hypothetical protein KIL84_015189 [Mauremys mutica]|uniref:Uncharacterized protein n=1 Tax=Mauremys mutica TaxID=74926 RepID=A0A9D4AM04_9SAUR|nr:hypothetical protein KIL84_015189 [Mauremys mutica]